MAHYQIRTITIAMLWSSVATGCLSTQSKPNEFFLISGDAAVVPVQWSNGEVGAAENDEARATAAFAMRTGDMGEWTLALDFKTLPLEGIRSITAYNVTDGNVAMVTASSPSVKNAHWTITAPARLDWLTTDGPSHFIFKIVVTTNADRQYTLYQPALFTGEQKRDIQVNFAIAAERWHAQRSEAELNFQAAPAIPKDVSMSH